MNPVLICEARDCNAPAALKVQVNAGERTIPLSLCAKCVGKFDIISNLEKERKGLAPGSRRPTQMQQARQHIEATAKVKPGNVISN